MLHENFYSTVKFINTKRENSRQEEMTTPTPEVKLVVELNFDVLKTLHSLQAELKSFREDSLNERKEQQAINEALLRNMTRGILQGNPTWSTNRSKRKPYHKRASSPREEGKEERTTKAQKGDHHSPSSDDSLSPKERNKEVMTVFRGSLEK